MNKQRYEICKRCIEDGRWDINLETGVVTGRGGSTGYSNGKYLMLDVSYKNKKYQFLFCFISKFVLPLQRY